MDLTGIKRVPVLLGAVCMGVHRAKGQPDVLVFASPQYGEIKVNVASSGGGKMVYSYVIHDEQSQTVTTYRGFDGDPSSDRIVDVTVHE